jgi:protein phosphatase
MAWRAALEDVPWHTVFRRFGIVLAAAQVVNAVRGVGITRALRRKLRRARRASAKRKRAAEARKAQKQAEKRAEAQRARAEADAKSAPERPRAAASSARSSRDDQIDPEPNRFGVAHSRDGPRDSSWLKGEYEENVPVHVEREIAAAALDEVAMALAAEGDANASAAVAGMALRVAAAESPKKIRLDALANLSNTLSTNLGSNALVSQATDRRTEKAGSLGSALGDASVAADRAPAEGERASPGSVVSARTPTTTPFSFRSDSNRGGSSAGPRSFAVSVSSSDRSADARGRSRDGSPSHESFAASAFEMAARAAAMGDDPEGLTSDEEAEEVELAERRRAAAAAAAAAAEAERMQAANEAALAAAAAAGATAARRASFDEWAAASRSSRDVEAFLSADDDASASVSSYHGSLDDYSSDSGSDVSDVQAASGAASAWLAKTRERMRLSPTRERGALFGRRRGAERDADARAREADGGEDFLFHRAGVIGSSHRLESGRDTAPARSRDESPIRREVERRTRALSASESEDDERNSPPRRGDASVARRKKPSTPPTLRLEVLSGVSRGDAVSAPPGVEFLTVGRGDARDLCVGDVEVSSSHAEFRWTWFASFLGDERNENEREGLPDALFGADDAGRARLGEWRVADVGSTNGTFVNGEFVGSGGRGRNVSSAWRALRHGDEIRLGERAESPALRVSLLDADFLDAPKDSLGAYEEDRGFPSFQSPTNKAMSSSLLLRSSVRVDPGKPPRMEDRALAECPLRGCADVALFAVFDGHAGADAAEKARRFFPTILANRLGRCAPAAPSGPDGPPGDAASALRDAFVETDQAIECEYEGCSIAALLVWRCTTTGGVYAQTANVGDAEICVGRYDASRVSARVLTRTHLIADPSERARFVAAGASVEHGAREIRGLRVSRAVGDFFLKRELPGLVATPYVSAPIRVRGDGCDVAVLATRGLWRVVDETEATSLATSARDAERRRDERGAPSPSSRRWSPAAGAARLVDLARRRRSREDVAVVVVRLEEAMGGGGSAA